MVPTGRNQGCASCSSTGSALNIVLPNLPRLSLSRGQRALGILGDLVADFRGFWQVDRNSHAILVGQRQPEAVGGFREHRLDGNPALGRFLLQRPLEFLVAVAEEGGAFAQFFRHFGREQLLALGAVDAHAEDLAMGVVEADAVAVVEGLPGIDGEPAVADFGHVADRFADEGRRIEGADVVLAAAGEIVGVAAVEGLVRLRGEGVGAAAAGGAGEFRVLRRSPRRAVCGNAR